jgi:dimethylhistidine N-methyltransferase
MQGGSINYSRKRASSAPFQVYDLKPEVADMAAEVIAGLSRPQKTLHPKFLYDETGSKLFEDITRLPEYYPTRTELGIFDDNLPVLARHVSEGSCLVEYGSGSSLKIRKVLGALQPAAYVPVDISREHLVDMAKELAGDFPDLAIYPTCADFTAAFALPPPVGVMPKVGFFPGSSIGNFSPRDAAGFLERVADTLGTGAQLIIGVDLKKDTSVLEAAYDDSAGVTAAFNLNLLSHLGEVLGADLNPDRFAHRAEYNEELGAVQMFLDVRESHEVEIGGRRIRFEAGEAVHTENSFKYEPEEFLTLVRSAGFEETGVWTDARGWFAVFLLEVARG